MRKRLFFGPGPSILRAAFADPSKGGPYEESRSRVPKSPE